LTFASNGQISSYDSSHSRQQHPPALHFSVVTMTINAFALSNRLELHDTILAR
jgi:hypothetical protein